ncbi:MAG: DUF1343 domain-containing protein [Prevotellaceae bacterium]|jgi:uncharacterized protein YbbC (DUF1343 family)|nr:DUF1343 domain-containing protein [Prevotellaceae bacterium]
MKKAFIFCFPAVLFLWLCLAGAVHAQRVKLGIDVLCEQQFSLLDGQRIGLITNQTGVDSRLRSTIDLLHEAPNVKLVALFSPEHGVRGNIHAGDNIDTSTDSKTGLPVYSLYGKTRKPTKKMLENIDVLVYDIQDIGCRSYTFISTMGFAMEAAGENNISFVVLDRPNPLGGEKIEGNRVHNGFSSFVSQFKIPYLYGQTCGELAMMLNEEKMLSASCRLTVVPMRGWKRSMRWEDTGLEWVPASPHIPHANSTVFYPMTGILGELGYLSIGIGYTLPFELVGAPWLDAELLAAAMNSLNLQGIHFRPIHFKPFYATFKGENCQGIQIHVTDYAKAHLAEVQFYVIQEISRLYPSHAVFAYADKARFAMFDKVCGSDFVRTTLSESGTYNSIQSFWEKDVDAYRRLSSKYYLYR